MRYGRFPWGILVIGGIFLALALLSGCATTSEPTVVTKVVERKIEVPKSLLTCSPEPVAGTAWISQKDLGKFMIKLADAGQDCRVKLAAVRKLVADW